MEAFGAKTINFPTLEIEAINAEETKALCQQLNDFDIAIFSSANAAHRCHEYWPSPFPISTVIAIGPGTQKTIEQYQITHSIMPQEYNSEGILALPELKDVQDKKIILFCGKDPHPSLKETLSQQGANVALCECYQRLCPKPKTESLMLLQTHNFDGIISTSKESLKNLESLLKNNVDIKKTPLIVISPGMEHLAKTQGWKHVVVAPNASNEAIVETLAKSNNIT